MTSDSHPADRLLATFERVGAPLCVGLDPVRERMPAALASLSAPAAIEAFSSGVMRAIAPFVGCIKIQSACYERYGHEGVAVLDRVAHEAKSLGLEVIYDAKRGDIGISTEHYAAASQLHAADWTTVNGYLGADGVLPFVNDGSRGAFVLVRTSNPSGDAFQSLRLADGRTIAESMADAVSTLGASCVGSRGMSAIGAVVGATKRTDAAELRRRMPQQMFLVPGYGAQGGGVDDVLPCFLANGTGAIVTASRSVIYPSAAGRDWKEAIAEAARMFRTEIRAGLGLR